MVERASRAKRGPHKRGGEKGHNVFPRGRWGPVARKRFLEKLAETGRMAHSARYARVSPSTVSNARREEEGFEQQVQDALSLYRDWLESRVEDVGMNGWEEPVYYKGELCGKVRRFSATLMLAHARRHIPGYREKVEADVTVAASVLVVPASAPTAEEWEQRYRQPEPSQN